MEAAHFNVSQCSSGGIKIKGGQIYILIFNSFRRKRKDEKDRESWVPLSFSLVKGESEANSKRPRFRICKLRQVLNISA